MSYLKVPNLPGKRVKKVIIGSQYERFKNSLLDLEIECEEISPNKSLQKPLMCHADMSVLHLGDSNFAFANGVEIKKGSYNKLFETKLSPKYPNDISLNIALVGKYAVIGKKNSNKELISFLKQMGYTLVFVNQGYCKCSCCIVNENAIITDDEGIYKTLKGFLDVLLINKGDIELDGYDYGFIGGASGLMDKNLIVFTGNIKLHRDFDKINSFLCKYNSKE